MSLPSTAATISTPNNKRIQRTSNPTPPEREDSKKSRRNNSSSSKKNMEKGKLDVQGKRSFHNFFSIFSTPEF
jgi:hypothetical protein